MSIAIEGGRRRIRKGAGLGAQLLVTAGRKRNRRGVKREGGRSRTRGQGEEESAEKERGRNGQQREGDITSGQAMDGRQAVT